MKNLSLAILLTMIVCSHSIDAQNNSFVCNSDSIAYKRIDSIITTMLDNQHIYLMNNKDLSEFLDQSDQACLIKNFALVFDNMFSRGLDLSKRLPKPLPRVNKLSLDSVINAGFNKERNNNEKQIQTYDLFFLFINVKSKYEDKMREFGMSDLTRDYIDKLVQHGAWSHPNAVQNALSLKYKHITKDKFYADMRYYNNFKE